MLIPPFSRLHIPSVLSLPIGQCLKNNILPKNKTRHAREIDPGVIQAIAQRFPLRHRNITTKQQSITASVDLHRRFKQGSIELLPSITMPEDVAARKRIETDEVCLTRSGRGLQKTPARSVKPFQGQWECNHERIVTLSIPANRIRIKALSN